MTSFVLGRCNCGCGADIPIKSKSRRIQIYKHGHNRAGIPSQIHGKWRGGKYFNDGYIRVMRKGHPAADKDGYVREHRLIMEEYLGRYLRTEEFIHHINHNRSDNRLENLQLMTPEEHSKLHFPKGSMFGANQPKD